jgi:hypothetical protein
MLEIFFVFDATLLANEAAGRPEAWARAAGLAAIGLGAIKLPIVARVLGLPLRSLAQPAIQLSLLLAIVGLAPHWATTAVWPVLLHTAAGLVAATVAVGLVRNTPPSAAAGRLVLLPALATALHILALGWIHHVHNMSDLAPFALAAGAVLLFRGYEGRAAVGFAAALLLSLTADSLRELAFAPGFVLTPFRGVLLAAGVLVGAWAWLSGHRRLVLLGAAVVIIGLAGHHPGVVFARLLEVGRLLGWSASMLGRFIAWCWTFMPRTLRGFGAVAVGASFVLLAVGAWLSLTRTSRESLRPSHAPKP